ncbi:MAG TPA: helix-turn-helix domain-containing protein [Longimicrobium sp.]
MSAEAQAWAISQRIGNATRKLVLWGLAGHAHKNGRHAWAGVDTLAEYAECDKRTVRRHLCALEAEGWIREGDQSVIPAYIRADQRPIAFDLAMDHATREKWRTQAAAGRATDSRRARAARAGAEGGRRSAAARWSEGQADEQVEAGGAPDIGRGDDLSPGEETPRGDNTGPDGVTPGAERGDRAVSPKPKDEPTPEPVGQSDGRARRDVEAMDEQEFVGYVVSLANLGMQHGAVGEAFNRLVHTNPLHRDAVERWRRGEIFGEGAENAPPPEPVPRQVIAAAVYRAARAYRPTPERRQIDRMSYFTPVVRQEAERHRTRNLDPPPHAGHDDSASGRRPSPRRTAPAGRPGAPGARTYSDAA